MTDREHPVLRDATRELNEGKLDRRDFLRIATLLGVSAGSAYGMAGLPTPADGPDRRAQEGRHAAHRHARAGSLQPAHLFLDRGRERRAPGRSTI